MSWETVRFKGDHSCVKCGTRLDEITGIENCSENELPADIICPRCHQRSVRTWLIGLFD